MNKIVEEILWRIYYASSIRAGRRGDIRFFLLNDMLKDIHGFTSRQLATAVYELKRQNLIEKKNYEGSILVSLSQKGMLRAINYKFRRLDGKKEKWDGKWRMVAFDIPNSYEKARKALVYRLKMGGFYEWQKSVFLYPYSCYEEVNAFIKLFKVEKYVRFGLLEFIDNQDKIKFHFRLK
ncbi:MAG: hypothetical protein Q8Q48_00870 [Candidatus Staskawiczbacteria bacterium]|nr:hypothetical protein [Candidatus Staskawiczbacteria bacterium]